ncbi:hypothetical protein KBA63_02785, partial [Candidatus Woesebacteria bacterium]|nr:hypothetical protein [Candidatus Woesebacteria bacterium]
MFPPPPLLPPVDVQSAGQLTLLSPGSHKPFPHLGPDGGGVAEFVQELDGQIAHGVVHPIPYGGLPIHERIAGEAHEQRAAGLLHVPEA